MNEQVKNIKNPRIQRIADECTYRGKGDFGMTIVGGVKLEEFADRLISECMTASAKYDDGVPLRPWEAIEQHFK